MVSMIAMPIDVFSVIPWSPQQLRNGSASIQDHMCSWNAQGSFKGWDLNNLDCSVMQTFSKQHVVLIEGCWTTAQNMTGCLDCRHCFSFRPSGSLLLKTLANWWFLQVGSQLWGAVFFAFSAVGWEGGGTLRPHCSSSGPCGSECCFTVEILKFRRFLNDQSIPTFLIRLFEIIVLQIPRSETSDEVLKFVGS